MTERQVLRSRLATLERRTARLVSRAIRSEDAMKAAEPELEALAAQRRELSAGLFALASPDEIFEAVYLAHQALGAVSTAHNFPDLLVRYPEHAQWTQEQVRAACSALDKLLTSPGSKPRRRS